MNRQVNKTFNSEKKERDINRQTNRDTEKKYAQIQILKKYIYNYTNKWK